MRHGSAPKDSTLEIKAHLRGQPDLVPGAHGFDLVEPAHVLLVLDLGFRREPVEDKLLYQGAKHTFPGVNG